MFINTGTNFDFFSATGNISYTAACLVTAKQSGEKKVEEVLPRVNAPVDLNPEGGAGSPTYNLYRGGVFE